MGSGGFEYQSADLYYQVLLSLSVKVRPSP